MRLVWLLRGRGWLAVLHEATLHLCETLLLALFSVKNSDLAFGESSKLGSLSSALASSCVYWAKSERSYLAEWMHRERIVLPPDEFELEAQTPWDCGRGRASGMGGHAPGCESGHSRRSVEEAGDWNRLPFPLARDGDGLSGQRTKSKRGSPEGVPSGAECEPLAGPHPPEAACHYSRLHSRLAACASS